MKYSAFIEIEGSLAFQLRFLAKMAGINITSFNPAMGYLLIEPSDKGDGLLGVASDGHCLHLVDPIPEKLVSLLELTTGYWKILKNTSKCVWIARLNDSLTQGWIYPDWRKVIPAGEAVYTTTFEGFDFTSRHHNFGKLAIFLHNLPEATGINLTYLHNLGTGLPWNVEWYGHNRPLKLTEGNCTAVIMPLQLF